MANETGQAHAVAARFMTHRSTTLLDRLQALIEEAAGPVPLAPAACRLMRTRDERVASAVLEGLVRGDGRFFLTDGLVGVLPEEELDVRTPLGEVPFAVMDFETSGCLPEERAIEVGVACFLGGVEVASFETLLDPGTAVAPFVVRLTGIRPEELAGQPPFEKVWPALSPLLLHRVLVAHNLPFDRRILRAEVSRLGHSGRVGKGALCTLKLARKLLPKEEPKSLDALAERFGLTFRARHRALDDARVTGQLLYRLLDMAADRAPMETLGDLRELLR